MSKKSINLFKSVISDFEPPVEWKDFVYLSPECRERFLTVSDIPELSTQHFFMAGLAELKGGYLVERDSVDVHTLLFTIEGEGKLTTATSEVVLKQNTLTVLPALTPFRFELNKPDGQWKMVWVLLNNKEKWIQIAKLGQSVIPFKDAELVWALMTLLHSEIEGRPAYRKLICSEISSFLTGVESKPFNSTARVQALFNEVGAQLHLPWTVKEMANRTFLSEEQLNRVCKSLYARSPQKKLIALRMQKAADLLHNREWSITMIAQRLGYKDPYNFTHRFKVFYGCSPRDYRKRIHQQRES
ncbi:helix-turn-helix transcriptional regulator [Vibrio sp. F74]|uniref:helix-turn-helix transcriptional regulator n=1 Tax=Vibrio sp. F74 TaxID=700020 RepID=UPI0035F536E9